MQKKVVIISKYFILCIIAVFFLFPIFWILIQSFKTSIDTIAIPPKLVFSPTLENYSSVLSDINFFRSLKDSLIIALFSVFLTLIIGVPFAYALARFRFRGANQLGFFVLSTMILPPIVIIIPFSKIFNYLRLLDTYPGLILAHILVNLALVVWVMRSFFLRIPIEVEEAAIVDGCTRMQSFRKIVLPLSSSGLTAVTILSFIFSWNELMFALSLTSSAIKTLPVFIATGYVGFLATNWGGLSAAGIIAIIPTIILILCSRKYLVTGFSFGTVSK